jgi:putative glycosyltransferase (TIGR04372 family)
MYTKGQILFEYSRVKNYSLQKIVIKLFTKITGIFIGVTVSPLTLIAHVLGYRYVNVFTERIGHLAIEPDSLIKESILNQKTSLKWIILAPYGKVANSHLLSYWSTHFIIIRSRVLCYLIYYATLFGIGKKNISRYINSPHGSQLAYAINALWDKKPPILSLSEKDLINGHEKLLQLGIPESAWFVCIHAREGKYSPVDEPIHQHRNSDITTYLDAINEITSRGGYVIRVGDRNTKQLPKIMGLIDYANSKLKSEMLDVFLLANAKFILGDSSGAALVGSVFGVPCALVNMTPITSTGILKKDIFIHKLHFDQNGCKLSLNDLRRINLANARNSSNYHTQCIEIRDNSPAEILEITIEMFNRLENKRNDEPLIDTNVSYLIDGDYSYGTKSRIGEHFLECNSSVYLQ